MIGFWKSSDRISRALLMVAGLLIVVVVFESIGVVRNSAPENLTADGSVLLPEELTGASPSGRYPAVGEFSAILRRPLFEESRRPLQSQAGGDDSASATMLKQKWRLSGIILDENNIAIMEATRSTETQSLIKGQLLDGWQVQEIDSNSVLLLRAGESLRLTMHENNPGAETMVRKRNTQAWRSPD